MKRLASIGSWPWWAVALVAITWLSLYGLWLRRRLESAAVSLAEMCSSLAARCNLRIGPAWYHYVLWLGPPVVLLAARWFSGRRILRAA